MDYIEYCKSELPVIMNNPIDILTHMFTVLGNGVNAKTFNPPEVHYYVDDDDGVTKESIIGKGMTLNAEYFNSLDHVSLSYLYPWTEKEEYQPFRKYHGIKDRNTENGIKSAMQYFIKCLEFSTIDTIKIEYCNYRKNIMLEPLEKYLDKKQIFLSSEREFIINEMLEKYYKDAEISFEKEKSRYETYLKTWKENIPVLKSEFGLE